MNEWLIEIVVMLASVSIFFSERAIITNQMGRKKGSCCS